MAAREAAYDTLGLLENLRSWGLVKNRARR